MLDDGTCETVPGEGRALDRLTSQTGGQIGGIEAVAGSRRIDGLDLHGNIDVHGLAAGWFAPSRFARSPAESALPALLDDDFADTERGKPRNRHVRVRIAPKRCLVVEGRQGDAGEPPEPLHRPAGTRRIAAPAARP